MFIRSKRVRAFTTGCLVSLVAFGYPSRLLAQGSTIDDPVQGVTSTTQEAPTTPSEFEDVITGIDAGVDAGSLIQPSPDPIREHTAFLSSMWDVLLDSNYIAGTSYLSTGEWITGPTGTVTATNETGNTLTVDIVLSLEILPDQWSSVDQASIDILENVSARIGMAWTTMSNADDTESNILIWWYQWNGQDGAETAIGPVTTFSQEDADLLAAVVPAMDGFFDDPLNYNIDDYNSDILGIWSRFRNAVLTAVVAGVAVVAAPLVISALVAATAITLPAAVVTMAGYAVAGAMATGAVIIVGGTGIAYLNLVDDLNTDGYPTSAINIRDNLREARLR